MGFARGVRLTAMTERFELKEAFNITGRRIVAVDVLVVTLRSGHHVGQGEATGVFYLKNNDPTSLLEQVESVRSLIESGLDRRALQRLLPPGGARNALDCALWDLEAKETGLPAWRIAELDAPRPLLTTFTISANTPEKMAADARAYEGARALKLKLTGEPVDADRVLAVRESCPTVWLGVDANQGLTRTSLEALLPTLIDARVQLLEQPFRVARDSELTSIQSPIPIAADESAQHLGDLQRLVGRYQVVNIKLDKCGGLTQGLAMARRARELGLIVMVGNMLGSSLAMAPALLLGQLCQVVDLDGPVFLSRDRSPSVHYEQGMISGADVLWGRARPER